MNNQDDDRIDYEVNTILSFYEDRTENNKIISYINSIEKDNIKLYTDL